MRKQIWRFRDMQSSTKPLSRHEKLKQYADLLAPATGLFTLFAIALVFLYCTLNRFNPDLRVEDTIVFVWVMLGFVFVISIGILYGALCWPWFYGAVDFYFKKTKKHQANRAKLPSFLDSSWIYFFSFVVFVFWCWFIWFLFDRGSQSIANVFLTFLVISFLWLVVTTIFTSTKRMTSLEFAAFNFVMLLLLFAFAKPTPILNLIFRSTAIRQENVDVVISPTNFKLVKEYADVYKAPIKFCYRKESDTFLLSNIDLAWYGVGKKALLVLKVMQKQDGKLPDKVAYMVKVPLLAEGVTPLVVEVAEGAGVKELDVRKDPCLCDAN